MENTNVVSFADLLYALDAYQQILGPDQVAQVVVEATGPRLEVDGYLVAPEANTVDEIIAWLWGAVSYATKL